MAEVPLRDYIERIVDERDRAQEARFVASQRALDATAKALDHRLEAMNEFRAQITNERALYVQRDQLSSILLPIRESVDRLEQNAAHMAGRYWSLGVFLAFLTVVLNAALTVILWAYRG